MLIPGERLERNTLTPITQVIKWYAVNFSSSLFRTDTLGGVISGDCQCVSVDREWKDGPEEFLDQIDVCHEHSATAVALKAKDIHSFSS